MATINLESGDCLNIPYDCIVTVENGIVLVKKKEPEFKKGDFVAGTDSDGDTLISIYDKKDGDIFNLLASYADWLNELRINDICYPLWVNRFATEEEKQILIEKLHEAGKDWDAGKCEVVDLVWKPREGDKCFYPLFNENGFYPCISIFNNTGADNNLLESNYMFSTKELCQDFCNKANELLKNAKKY